ncbi:MAG: hypothetical protein HQ485_01305 [Acidobacteria bacterium]|nr:hypothetical protein [Acidobacteriota bacterium]
MAIEHRVREAVDAYVARMRHDIDAHVRSLTSDPVRMVGEQEDHWRRELEHGVSEARAAAERTFGNRVDTIRGEVQRELDQRLVQPQVERPRAERQQAGHAQVGGSSSGQAVSAETLRHDVHETRVDTVERLLASVRQIDDSTTLSGILEALAKGAAAKTSRVAVLLVDGDMFRTWGHFGFAPGVGPTEMPIGSAGTLAAAVALRQTSFVPPLVAGRETTVPAFMQVPVGFTGFVVPLSVGGEVVAVLYADDVNRTAEQEDAPVWTEEVELLARHAAQRLENVTSVRTVEVMTQADRPET